MVGGFYRVHTGRGKDENLNAPGMHFEPLAFDTGFNLPDCPGHPTWMEPLEWLGGEGVEKFPLHLLSDQPARRLHSQLDVGAFSQASKVPNSARSSLSPSHVALARSSSGASASSPLDSGVFGGSGVPGTGALYQYSEFPSKRGICMQP